MANVAIRLNVNLDYAFNAIVETVKTFDLNFFFPETKTSSISFSTKSFCTFSGRKIQTWESKIQAKFEYIWLLSLNDLSCDKCL